MKGMSKRYSISFQIHGRVGAQRLNPSPWKEVSDTYAHSGA